MAKVKYDVSKAEAQQFSVPKPDVYDAVLKEASHGNSSSGNPMFTLVFQITKGDFKDSRVWYYILTDGTQDWRMREFTDALGLKPKGEIDTDQIAGKAVKIRTAIDPARDGYDEKARIKNVLPAAGDGTSAEGGEDDDEPYTEWSIEDLKEEAEARELEIAGRKTKPKLIAALEADDVAAEAEEGGEEEEGEEEGDEEGEEELTLADLKGMSRAELKVLVKEEELDVKILKKDSDDDLRTKIAEALELDEDEEEEEGDEEGDEEEGDEEEADNDYDEWDVSDLKGELKERGLKVDGRKSVLVARLKKDDESGKEPF